jgi:hypothetical protein
MEPINVYTAVSIDYDREARIMKLNQTRYVNEELAYREDRGGSKLCSIGSVAATPMFNTSMNLRLQEPNPNNESLLEYTGKLRYVVDRTRPGCLNAVGEISVGGNVNPSDLHIKTLNKTIHYMKSTADMGLWLRGDDPDAEFFGICDAAHRTEGNSRPRYGGAIFKGWRSGAVHSFSQQGLIPARSSMHAEVVGIDKLIELALLTLQIARFCGYKCDKPFKIYTDSKSGVELLENLKITAKTSSINMRVNHIRDLINRRVIMLVFIPGFVNTADVLTKSLSAEDFQRHEHCLQYGFDGITLEQRADEYRRALRSKKEMVCYLSSTDDIDEVIELIKNYE